MPKRKVTVVKKSGEGSAADRRWDKAHPNAKEGSKAEEAFDKRMAKRRKK